MDKTYWPDTNEAVSEKFFSYRARAELLVSICGEIRTAVNGLAEHSRQGSRRPPTVAKATPVRRQVKEFVQQLARMEELARQLMDHAVEAEAIGSGHMEECRRIAV